MAGKIGSRPLSINSLVPKGEKMSAPKDFYVYQTNVGVMAPGASANAGVNIEADSDFILQKLACWSEITGWAQTEANRVLPSITVQITDTGSGRQIFSESVPIPSIFGHGALPFILPNPRRFASNSMISIYMTNISDTTTYQATYLQFIGVKVYKTI